MKLLLMLVVIGMSCGERRASEEYLGKFAANKEEAKAEDAEEAGEYYYARYRFTHVDYEDVEVAVRVEMVNGHAAKLHVKDLSPQAAANPIEEAVLHTRGCQLAFMGTSAGAEGGTYTGELELRGGVVDGCCGRMTFVPAVNTSLTFVGTKLSTLTAAEWEQLSGEASTDEEDAGDETDDDGETGDSSSEQKFYALDSTTILLSKTAFLPPETGAKKRYLMQAVIGTNTDGTHKPPVVHIKRVSTSGALHKGCLSLRFDQVDTAAGSNDTGRFKFNYKIETAKVDYVWGYSDMYDNDIFSDESFFTVGVQFPNGPGSSISYSALRAGAGTNGEVPLVPENRVADKRSEWGISTDIVAAFGDNSGCDPLGHNRRCTGCIMQ